MSTLYTHPSFSGPHDARPGACMAYDGEGIEVGYMTLEQARKWFAHAEYDPETNTITVER